MGKGASPLTILYLIAQCSVHFLSTPHVLPTQLTTLALLGMKQALLILVPRWCLYMVSTCSTFTQVADKLEYAAYYMVAKHSISWRLNCDILDYKQRSI